MLPVSYQAYKPLVWLRRCTIAGFKIAAVWDVESKGISLLFSVPLHGPSKRMSATEHHLCHLCAITRLHQWHPGVMQPSGQPYLKKCCQWARWPCVNLGCNHCCTCCGYCKERQAQNWTALIPIVSLCVVTSSRPSGIENCRHRGLGEVLNSLSLSCPILALNEPLMSFALRLLTWRCAHLMWMRTLGLFYWIR